MQTTKNIIKYLILGGLFIIPFIPFIVPGAMYFPFIAGKGFAFRIIVEIIFGLFVVLAFADKEYRPKMSWMTKAVLFFTGAVLLADIFGVNAYKSIWSNYERMEGFVLIAHLAMFYIVSSSVLNSQSKWFQFFNVSIFASAMMSVYGLFQVFGAVTINQGGTRVDATLGNATYLAIYLVFHIFLCLYLLIDSAKPIWQRWSYACVGLLNLIILYFTATRGAILGLIGGLLLAGLIVLFKERDNAFIRKSAYVVMGLVLIVITGFFSIKNTDFAKNNQVLGRFSSLGFAEIKTQGRYFVWPMAIEGFKENPILGWGQENFNYVFNKNYDPRMHSQEQWFDRTHDIFLDWLIAGGLVGLLSYLSLYVALLYYIWRKESTLKVTEKGILTGLIAAYIFHNIFVFDNLISYIVFFSLLGFIHSINVSRMDETESSGFYTKTFSQDAVNYIVAPVVLIATIFTVYYVNIPALFANQTLIQAMSPQENNGGIEKNLALFKQVYSYKSFGDSEATEQLVQIAIQINSSDKLPANIKQQFVDLAKEKVTEKLKQTPNDARYLVFAGSFYNRINQYDEAIKYLDRAMIASPRKQSIYSELASSYLGKQNYQKMFDLLKQSYELAPEYKEAQILYALSALYVKNKPLAVELLNKVGQDVIISDNRFLQTYAAIGDYDSAVTILKVRLQKDPKNAQYKLSLASLYVAMGQKQMAIDLMNQIIKDDPTFKDQGESYIKQIQNS